MVVAFVGLGGCEHKQSNRWPDHRQHEEARITELEKQIVEIKVLENRIEQLEAAMKQTATAPAPTSP